MHDCNKHTHLQEDYLSCELESLNRKYQRRAEINWVDFYTQKLEDVNSALITLQKQREIVGVCHSAL
jgi:hypothetical protein